MPKKKLYHIVNIRFSYKYIRDKETVRICINIESIFTPVTAVGVYRFQILLRNRLLYVTSASELAKNTSDAELVANIILDAASNPNPSMSDRLDRGDKNDETSTHVDATFSCADCGQEFNSCQELKEHESTQH